MCSMGFEPGPQDGRRRRIHRDNAAPHFFTFTVCSICRFRDPELVREVDWNQSLEHCGLCQFCRPLPEGVTKTHQVKKF